MSVAASSALFPPRCECVINGDVCAVNHALLALVQSQLDRCGPSQLNCPAPRRAEEEYCSSSWWVLSLAVFAGILIGIVTTLFFVRTRFERKPATGAIEDSVATPSTRRRQ